MVMAEELTDSGYEVVGPVGRLDKAVAMARDASFDMALLDANLHGERVFPVADILIERGVPFVFLTGYAMADVPPRFLKYRFLQKPTEIGAVLQQLSRIAPADSV